MKTKLLVAAFGAICMFCDAVNGMQIIIGRPVEIPVLSATAQNYLENPVVHNGSMNNENGSTTEASLDQPECIAVLNSFFDGMDDEQKQALFNFAKEEICFMSDEIFRINDLGGFLNFICTPLDNPASSPNNPFSNFLNRDPRLLQTIRDIVGCKIPENTSIEAQIGLFAAAFGYLYSVRGGYQAGNVNTVDIRRKFSGQDDSALGRLLFHIRQLAQ